MRPASIFFNIQLSNSRVSILGVEGAVFFRIFNNILGAVYGLLFNHVFQYSVSKIDEPAAQG